LGPLNPRLVVQSKTPPLPFFGKKSLFGFEKKKSIFGLMKNPFWVDEKSIFGFEKKSKK